jgi:protein gp37
MGRETKISWCDHTFNPWWGCTPVSAGCEECYAAAQAKRWGWNVFGGNQRRFFGDGHWNEPLQWNVDAKAEGIRRRVFSGSMCDVFENLADLEVPRDRLFNLIEKTPDLDWLLVTKRPENIPELVPQAWMDDGWPSNVWLIVTTENQAMLEQRVAFALRIPAPIIGLSCEPLLGPLNLRRIAVGDEHIDYDPLLGKELPGPVCRARVHWVIVGGESGPAARACYPHWIRDIQAQCKSAGVPFFMKQMGSAWAKQQGKKDSKGGDPAEWPEDLRVQEFPAT